MGIIGVNGGPVEPKYTDVSGKVYEGRERQGRKLAALHVEGLSVVEIQYFQ